MRSDRRSRAGRALQRQSPSQYLDDVSWADWERVLAARRAAATCPIEDLRYLGPTLEPEQVLLTVDEVLTRRPEVGHFL